MMRYQLTLFADYFQFYMQCESAKGDLSESWTLEATERLLAVAEGTIGVGTVRNMDVPVTVELFDEAPGEAFAEWDHVTECSIDVASGTIVIAGCTDYFPDAQRIMVLPGTYRARVHYGGLDTVSANRSDGDDRYHVALWPGDVAEPRVLKHWQAAHREP